MFSGTESETKEFMQVCVQTVNKYPGDDYRSPVFIFERLCSIIFPVSFKLKNYFNSFRYMYQWMLDSFYGIYIFQEENDVGEFLMILEKDPQQEDFLQGRMLGNPYSSNEPGLGPLMRDVKNKICQGTVYSEKTLFVLTYFFCTYLLHVYLYFTDCELVALLEDDTGMEVRNYLLNVS